MKQKKRKKLSPRSVEICRTVLNTILEDARAKGYIFVNPMDKVRKFEVPERELSFLKPLQVKALCKLVGRFYGIMFLIMAFCGLRIGEVTGLKRPDIDLDHGLIFVRRQVIWRRKKDCPDGEPRWALVEPKSKAGIRVVEIPQPMLPLVAAHLEALNGVHSSLELVFPGEAGTPIDPKNVRRRHFAPAMKAAGHQRRSAARHAADVHCGPRRGGNAPEAGAGPRGPQRHQSDDECVREARREDEAGDGRAGAIQRPCPERAPSQRLKGADADG